MGKERREGKGSVFRYMVGESSLKTQTFCLATQTRYEVGGGMYWGKWEQCLFPGAGKVVWTQSQVVFGNVWNPFCTLQFKYKLH